MRPWILCLLLAAGPAVAADDPDAPAEPKEKPVFMMMGFVKKSMGQAQFAGREKLERTLADTEKKVAEVPPEKKAAVVERDMPAINAAAEKLDATEAPEAVHRVNDAMAQFNNAAGRYDDAKRFADRALDQDKADHGALISRSAANLGLNRLDEAYADADKAAKLAPDDAGAFRSRALVSYARHDYLQAQEDARRALALDPNDQSAFYIMQLSAAKVPAIKLDKLQSQLAGEVQREYHGMVQQMNQVAERAHEETALTARGPSSGPLQRLVRSAREKIEVKDFAGALADADKALAMDPTNEEAYYQRAAANNLVGNYTAAIDDATQALMIDPSDVRARDARAWAYNNLGRFRDAIADANHSIERNPRNPYGFYNLGYAHERLGDLSAMMREYQSAANLSPKFELAYRDAANRHGLEAFDRKSARREAPVPQRERERRRSFAVVLISSVIGGILISLGFIHLYGEAKGASPGKSRPAPPPLPSLGPAYTLGRELGHGGMGMVYEAFDNALERKVAVKVMRPETMVEPKARELFLQEARTVAALHHPAIVDIHAIVEDKAGLCLVFEHIEGRTLEEILRERGRLSLAEARSLLKPVCQGLDYAHRHGVVHRDLKPGNIMLTTEGEVKLMDFGISRHERMQRDPLTPIERATARGTPYYMAPEQEHGEVRRESDVFSLGACLYEMVTGRRPYPQPYSLSNKLARDFERPSKLDPALPKELDALLEWALNPDPHERIRTAGDFFAVLDRIKDATTLAA